MRSYAVGGCLLRMMHHADVLFHSAWHYAWNIKEGAHCFSPQDQEHPPKLCRNTGYMGEPLIDPIIEYNHAEEKEAAAAAQQRQADSEIVGEVLVGGYVYRGITSAVGRSGARRLAPVRP